MPVSPSQLLDERVMAHAAAAPDAPAIGSTNGWHTYADLAGAVRAQAAALQARGIGPGEFVLNMLPAGFDAVVAGLAIQRTGACLVEVDRGWGRDFLAGIVNSTGARHAFARAADHRLLPGVTLLESCQKPGCDAGFTPIRRHAEDLALLLFTSGSTGRPRGVQITYKNIAANTAGIVQYLDLHRDDRVLSILPLFYCYGRSLLQTHLWTGASIWFDHRFMYPRAVLEALAREKCTGFAGVPVTFEVLRRQCHPIMRELPALRYVTQAGGGMSADLRLWARDAFAPAQFFVMYGQTEATARLTYLPPDRLGDKPTSIGVPIPGVELRVVDDAGHPVTAGAVANLVARGDNVTSGYFNDPEGNREILRDGWLWTGDLAYCDEDGFFHHAGRKHTMLKVSGHRFAPEEVEGHLARHPAVKEACVVAVPDATAGQAAWAFVVLQVSIEVSALSRFCADGLPAYKRPRRFLVMDALPRSATGKINRAELETRALEFADPHQEPRNP